MLLLLIFGATAAANPAVAPRRVEPARTIQATAADLFKIADDLSHNGRTADAERLLELLAQDPNSDVRNEARYRHAKLLRTSGREREAALLLRLVVDERPDAVPVRLELAQVLDDIGDKEGAWRQVRAAQAVGLPSAVARIVDRYSEALRASRPSGASLEIGLAPDSNINHATRSDTLGTIFGDFDISKDSKAQSGTGLALNGQVYRRFELGDNDRQLLMRLSGTGDLYRKGRFNDVVLDLAAGPEFQLRGSSRLNVELGATQRWFGQKPFMRSLRLGATLVHPLGRLTQLRINSVAAIVDNRLNDLEDGKLYSGEISVERALSATTGIAVTGSGARQALRDPGYSTRSWRVGLVGWHDVGRVTLTAEAQLGPLKADERLLLFPDKRKDRYRRLGVGATFRQLQFRGFAPVVRFAIERNRSTMAFYDYRRTRTEFGVIRAF